MPSRIAASALVLLGVLAARLSAQQPAGPAKPGAVPDSAVMTPAIIDQGRKLFHGRGTCFACHGDKLQGGPIAPSLQGPTWRHIDGTFESIIHRIDEGYPGTAMVGHPGNITEAQVLMAAVYIYAVSHGVAKP
jgi:mono/diheme cytochrome c family protein